MAMETAERELNGLHPEKLEAFLQGLREEENLRGLSGPWRSRVTWQGGFKARAHMRTHAVDMDEPSALDTQDTAASAHEMVLSAVGSCMMVGFILNATRQGVKVNNLEIALEGEFDTIAKWAGLTDTGNPGYGGITAKAFVSADADEDTLRAIWKKAVEGSPVTQTVSHPTPIDTEIEIVS